MQPADGVSRDTLIRWSGHNECAVQSEARWAEQHGSASSFTDDVVTGQYSDFMLMQSVHAGWSAESQMLRSVCVESLWEDKLT